MSYKLYKLDYKSRSVEKPSSPGELEKRCGFMKEMIFKLWNFHIYVSLPWGIICFINPINCSCTHQKA